MFEDLIPNKQKIWVQKVVDKNSIIKDMRKDIKLKDDHIMELVNEIVDLRKELDYLRDL